MLINFTVQNWMSFHNEARFSMVASKEMQHSDRVPVTKKYSAKVLPVAIVYGGNGSGKTNLFKAFAFIKSFVLRGARPGSKIPIEHFLLDPKSASESAKFSIEFLMDEKIYEFSFAVTRTTVVEEGL